MNPAFKGAKHLLRLALLVALLPPVFIALGSIGTRLGWWGWRTGFVTMTIGWAPAWAWISLIGALLALYVAAFAGLRRLWPYAAVALVVPIAVLAGFNQLRAKARAVPVAIHDVSTDWADPVMLSDRLMRQRGPDANPVERDPQVKWDRPVENWAKRRVADFNAEYCPGAKPVVLDTFPAQSLAQVKRVARHQRLEITGEDVAAGRLEAVSTSLMYGFKDDVVFRVRPHGPGSRIDIRSISRVGGSDLGANCRRVTELVQALE